MQPTRTHWPTHLFPDTWHDFKHWFNDSFLVHLGLVILGWILVFYAVPTVLLCLLALHVGINLGHPLSQGAILLAWLCYYGDLTALPLLADGMSDGMCYEGEIFCESEHRPPRPEWQYYCWGVGILAGEIALCWLVWWAAVRM